MNALPPLAAADLDHVLAHTRSLWDELRGKRLLITGGTGFFGCWLLETFAWANRKLNLGASVTILTRSPDAFKLKTPHLTADPAVRLHQGDIRSFEFPAGEFSHIIHAAAESSTRRCAEQPLTMFDTIVQGTRHVLDFAVACKARKLLFTSSGAVYGRQPSELTHVPEDYPGAPDSMSPGSAHGEGKRAAELLCRLYAEEHGLQVKIARCFGFVGPHLPLDANFAAGNFIRDALRGGPILVAGDGTPRRSFLYAGDLAVWLWTILFRGEAGRAYNVGSDTDLSILELSHEVRKALAPQTETQVSQTAESGKPTERYIPDIARARTELGLDVSVPLPEAIRRTAHWYASLLPSVPSSP